MDKIDLELYLKDVLFHAMDLDPDDPNLKDTPKRIAKMYTEELFKNIEKEYEGWTLFPNDQYDQLIMIDNIHFTSMCSHHFLPFTGKAWIVYLPDEKIAGASKMARVVEHYAARPQIQETLCHEIIENFEKNVEPSGCIVMMRAIHACMGCRGVKQYAGTGMGTSAISGSFHTDPALKQEALEMIKMSMR